MLSTKVYQGNVIVKEVIKGKVVKKQYKTRSIDEAKQLFKDEKQNLTIEPAINKFTPKTKWYNPEKKMNEALSYIKDSSVVLRTMVDESFSSAPKGRKTVTLRSKLNNQSKQFILFEYQNGAWDIFLPTGTNDVKETIEMYDKI